MRLVKNPAEMQQEATSLKLQGKTIGFVPTMGYLHKGHLALVQKAREECNIVVVSIFVNPTQFSPGEDFERYPRDLRRDQALLLESGVDYLFYPEAAAIYPSNYKTFAEVKTLQDKLCGAFRPGHFKGVCTIVLKLFNLVMPNRAYFGIKDAQQLRIIEKMVEDFNLNIIIVPVPTVREADGLAMSSRNIYLTPQERQAAPLIYQGLLAAKTIIEQGERRAAVIQELIMQKLQNSPLLKPQYLSIVSYETLEDLEYLQGKVLIALAAFLGKTRLIDNLIVEI